MSIEDFIITVYCLVETELKKIIGCTPLRQRGFEPKLSDSEVITMELVGEFMGKDTDTSIWRYFKKHWLDWFPGLGSRVNYAKQSANLWKIKQEIQAAFAKQMGALTDPLHIADGLPMPVCHFKRAGFSSVFRGVAAYGYCASKSETYYGFKGNLVISSEGIITCITITPAHIDERESLWDIVENIHGLLIADKGLIGENYQEQIRTHTHVNLQTPTRNNMSDPRGKDCNFWLTSTRRLVETVIGQLATQFHIEKIRATDLWHLTNRIARKILAHTVGVMINKLVGNPPLQFELLGIV
ncbi:transposase (DDE domain) [Legionella santicrucis]|uniref:Transposase (DDE domain) n=1 Tax=Legionella santicrucis TaxID=45074 RepID=A0A0W0YTV8_9GAMM|nr:IS982 family transposase [Legionella santicrucis]KTD60316.1 transposase (DDE domain) [Legionella santicrucis]